MNICFLRLAPHLMIKNKHPRIAHANICIGYSMALLEKEGHSCSLIDTEVEDLSEINADMVFIDTKSPTTKLALSIAKKIKKPVIAFGQQATAAPETLLFDKSPFDACVIGEYEYTIRDLVKKGIKKGVKKTKGIAYFDKKIIYTKKRKPIENLDKLPIKEAQDILLKKKYFSYYHTKALKPKWGFILSNRGCPFRCIFCSQTLRISYGANYRKRSSVNIAEEIEYLVSKGINSIYFTDDNFIIEEKFVNDLCDELIKRKTKVNMVAQTRVDKINQALLFKMKKAGFTTLSIGVESGSERIIKILKKDETKKQIETTFRLLKKAGIMSVGYFMIGNPTETRQEIEETFRFCKKIKPDMIQVAFFTAYPGSALYPSIKDKVKLEDMSHYDNLSFNFSRVDSGELKNIQKNFYKRYYLNPFFISRYLFKRFPYFLFSRYELNLAKTAFRFLFR